MNPRLLALQILLQVIYEGKSLSACTSQINTKIDQPQDRALAREIISGVLRHLPTLKFYFAQLIKKPLKRKDADISCLVLAGLYQIFYMRVPDHAAVSETVKLTQKLKKGWAKSLMNGVLRQSIRDKDRLMALAEADDVAKYVHPEWMLNRIKADWPDDWHEIVEQNNLHAPMVLRVNQQRHSREQYLAMLDAEEVSASEIESSPYAILLDKPCDVSRLPGFADGDASVQDSAAQLAAELLQLGKGQKVLDACAAPGGKTAHILETEPDLKLLALDISEDRTEKITETLQRLQLHDGRQSVNSRCQILTADAGAIEGWWQGELFDRILLDAPCSAMGVIRRNPDIKIHRTEADIEQLVNSQRNLLNAMWRILKPGGILLYATCSILKVENEHQITAFLNENNDASELEIISNWGRVAGAGKQILPGHQNMDGFYYARIKKMD